MAPVNVILLTNNEKINYHDASSFEPETNPWLHCFLCVVKMHQNAGAAAKADEHTHAWTFFPA